MTLLKSRAELISKNIISAIRNDMAEINKHTQNTTSIRNDRQKHRLEIFNN